MICSLFCYQNFFFTMVWTCVCVHVSVHCGLSTGLTHGRHALYYTASSLALVLILDSFIIQCADVLLLDLNLVENSVLPVSRCSIYLQTGADSSQCFFNNALWPVIFFCPWATAMSKRFLWCPKICRMSMMSIILLFFLSPQTRSFQCSIFQIILSSGTILLLKLPFAFLL